MQTVIDIDHAQAFLLSCELAENIKRGDYEACASLAESQPRHISNSAMKALGLDSGRGSHAEQEESIKGQLRSACDTKCPPISALVSDIFEQPNAA